MRPPFRIRRAPEPLGDIPTRDVAIGSLSGIAPADVRANLLIVADAGGTLLMSGTACDELALAMLNGCAEVISRRLYEAHACGNPS